MAVAAVASALMVHGSGRQLAMALAAALVAFLVYNRPPARIYLGDGGAYLLGTALDRAAGRGVGPARARPGSGWRRWPWWPCPPPRWPSP